MRRAVLLVALAACGGAKAPSGGGGGDTLDNQAGPPTWAPTLRASADALPGWIGLAARPVGENVEPWWIAHDADAAVVIPMYDAQLAEGAEVVVVPTSGATRNYHAGAAREILYGCDGGFDMKVVPLAGERVPAGAVWVVPMPLNEGWAPRAVVLEPGRNEADVRTWTAGALSLSSRKIDSTHMTLEVVADGRVLGAIEGEVYFMDGADPEPVNLTQEQPGIPYPVAAFELAPGGPMLVTVHQPSFEGVHLNTYLVGADAVTPVESMSQSLYYCAF